MAEHSSMLNNQKSTLSTATVSHSASKGQPSKSGGEHRAAGAKNTQVQATRSPQREAVARVANHAKGFFLAHCPEAQQRRVTNALPLVAYLYSKNKMNRPDRSQDETFMRIAHQKRPEDYRDETWLPACPDEYDDPELWAEMHKPVDYQPSKGRNPFLASYERAATLLYVQHNPHPDDLTSAYNEAQGVASQLNQMAQYVAYQEKVLGVTNA